MNAVIQISAPVFGLAVLGYAATRLGLFSSAHADGLARFVHTFAVPLMLLRTFAHTDPAEHMPWHLVLAYYAPMGAFYLGGIVISRAVFKRDLPAQIITGFSFSYGNAILLGLPLAMLTFGEEGAIPFFILLGFHAMSAFTLTTIGLEYACRRDATLTDRLRRMVSGVFTNPIILAILIGSALARLGWRLPGPVDALSGFAAGAVTPCALFALGATLTRYGLAGRLAQTGVVVLAKCVAFPLAVWFCCRALGVAPQVAAVAVLLAAQPVGVNIFLFAERYNTARGMATTAVFLSTLFSLASIPLLLYLIDLHGLR